MQAALASLSENDVFAVYDLSRLARNTADALLILQTIQDKKAEFYCLTLDLDTKTPAGRMMFTFLSSFNQFERENTAQKVKDNMQWLSKEGLLGKKPPFGYNFVAKKKPYSLHENQQQVIELVRQWVLKDPKISINQIVSNLNDDEAARAAQDGKNYFYRTVAQWMVDNEIISETNKYKKRRGLEVRLQQ